MATGNMVWRPLSVSTRHPVEEQRMSEENVNGKGETDCCLFPFLSCLETVLVTDPQVAEGTNLCVAKLYVNLFSSFPVSPACLLGVDREVWPSTQLKDHFCTAFACLPLQAECRLGRLLLWKFQETWLDAPTSPQVSCYCILHRCRSWKDYSSNCVINAF